MLTASDARKIAQWPGRHRCVRLLIEPLDTETEDAVRHAAEMERIMHTAVGKLEQVYRGDGIASWPVNRRTLLLGHSIRTGLAPTNRAKSAMRWHGANKKTMRTPFMLELAETAAFEKIRCSSGPSLSTGLERKPMFSIDFYASESNIDRRFVAIYRAS